MGPLKPSWLLSLGRHRAVTGVRPGGPPLEPSHPPSRPARRGDPAGQTVIRMDCSQPCSCGKFPKIRARGERLAT